MQTNFIRNDKGVAASVVAAFVLLVIIIGAVLSISTQQTTTQKITLQNELDTITLNTLAATVKVVEHDRQEHDRQEMVENALEGAKDRFNQECIKRYGKVVSSGEHICKALANNPSGQKKADFQYGCFDSSKPIGSRFTQTTNYETPCPIGQTIAVQGIAESTVETNAIEPSAPKFNTVKNKSTATIDKEGLDWHVLIDNSLSMGFSAATDDALSQDDPKPKDVLENQLLGVKFDNLHVCFFACHEEVGLPMLRRGETYPNIWEYDSAKARPDNPYARTRVVPDGVNPDGSPKTKTELVYCPKNPNDDINNHNTAIGLRNTNFADLKNNYWCDNAHPFYLENGETGASRHSHLKAEFNDPENFTNATKRGVMGIKYYTSNGALARAMTKDNTIIVDKAAKKLKTTRDALKKIFHVNVLLYYMDDNVTQLKQLSPSASDNALDNPNQIPLSKMSTQQHGMPKGWEEGSCYRKFGTTWCLTNNLENRWDVNTSNFHMMLNNFNVKNNPHSAPSNPKFLKAQLFVSDGAHDRAKNIFDPETSNVCGQFKAIDTSKDFNIGLYTLRIENFMWYYMANIFYREKLSDTDPKLKAPSSINIINNFNHDTYNHKKVDSAGFTYPNDPDMALFKTGKMSGDDSDTRNRFTPVKDFKGEYGFTNGLSRIATQKNLEKCAEKGGAKFFDTLKGNLNTELFGIANDMLSHVNVILVSD